MTTNAKKMTQAQIEAESAREIAEREAAEAATRATEAQARLNAVLAEQERERQAKLLGWAREVVAFYPDELAAARARRDTAQQAMVAAFEDADLAAAYRAYVSRLETLAEEDVLVRRLHTARELLPEAERAATPPARQPAHQFTFTSFASVIGDYMGDGWKVDAWRHAAIKDRAYAEYYAIQDAE